MPTNEMGRLLRPLSPISDLDGGDEQFPVYKTFLEDAFEQPEIKNIALSGNFGAGKSSILHSFDKCQNRGKEKYLYISMADFELTGLATEKHTSDESTSESEESTKAQKTRVSNEEDKQDPKLETQKRVEYSLLCQILTRCRRYHLRDSDLHGIPEAPMRRGTALVLALFAALIFVLLYHSRFAMWAEFMGVPPECRAKIHTWMYIIAMVGVGVLTWCSFRRFRLQKLSLTSPHANAEMALAQDNTSLDLYKFELVYALERIASRIDYTVVFEDMDRLDPKICAAVMTKLRDINGMVNTRHRELHRFSENHIRFVYAVGEDVLNHTQRTKFFDCIIPVVPAMNRYNAEIIICQMLRKYEVDIDDDILWMNLQRLFPFLSDYRTVITFCNEFQVMRSLFPENYQEQRDPINDLVMLSLCFFKVMAPKSYALLFHEQRDGTLPQVTEENLVQEYEDEKFRKDLVVLLNSLPISYRALEILYLSRDSICQQYMEILTTGAEPRRIELAHKIAEDKSVDLSEDLIRERLFETEDNPNIAFDLASHIRTNRKIEEYESWFYSPGQCGDHKFTNCMTCLAADLDDLHTTVALPRVDVEKLFGWCIDNLPSLTDDSGHTNLWKSRMIELLRRILETKLEDVPDALMIIQLDEKLTVGDLLADEVEKRKHKQEEEREKQQENAHVLEQEMLRIVHSIDETALERISVEEFIDWCMDILIGSDEIKRLLLSHKLYAGFPSAISLDLIRNKIVEYEPDPSIASNLIGYLFDTTKRDKFDQWFFELGHARKFSGCIHFISESFERRLQMFDFTNGELYEWAVKGLRLLCKDTEHLDLWDSDMCRTLTALLVRGTVGNIPEDILHVRLTHDTTVADLLGIDLDTTAEESVQADKEASEEIPYGK